MAVAASRLNLSSNCESEAIDAGRLFEEHSDRLFAYCLRYLGSRPEAEDALQTTFLYAHRALERGVVPQAEYPWLHAIAKNVCRWQQRTTARRGQLSTAVDLDAFPDPRQDDGDELELAAGLSDALASIPEGQRRALVLREWHGLSSNEVAARLGMSAPATYALLTRARKSLAHALTTGVRRPLHGLNLGSLLLKLKGLLAGTAAKVVAASVVAGSVAIGGVAVEKTFGEGEQPSTTPPAAVEPATGLELRGPEGGSAAARSGTSERTPRDSTLDGSSPAGATSPVTDPSAVATPGASGDTAGEPPVAGVGPGAGPVAAEPPKALPKTPAPPADPTDLLPLPVPELPPLPVEVPPLPENLPAVEDAVPDPAAAPPLPAPALPDAPLPLPLP